MQSYPILLLTEKQQAVLKKRIDDAVQRWAEEWFLCDSNDQLIEVSINSEILKKPRQTNNTQYMQYSLDEDTGYMLWSDDTKQSLLRCLIHITDKDEATNPNYTSLCFSALESLLYDITENNCSIEQANEPCEASDWKWYLQLKIANSELSIELPASWLDTQFVKETAAKPKADIKSAIGKSTVDISVTLKPIEITAEEALTLAVGDIISLDHRIDQALQLRKKSTNNVLSECSLSKSDNQKSIILS